MEGRGCKICFRNFANGRALGGHMRSHTMSLYYASKREENEEHMSSVSPSSSSEEEDEEKNGVAFGAGSVKRKKPKFRSIYNDRSPEEKVAYCLMMLSRDKWEKEKGKISEEKVGGKYRCETCRKMFRSYQALGGHRASHVKVKAAAAAAVVVEERIYECPFCARVFSSGQALGGHKRSHFVGAAAISGNVGGIGGIKPFSRTGEREIWDVDLNLPAQTDDD